MSSSASPAPSRRKTLLSLGVLALLTGIVVVFSNMVAQIINDKIDPRMKHERGELL